MADKDEKDTKPESNSKKDTDKVKSGKKETTKKNTGGKAKKSHKKAKNKQNRDEHVVEGAESKKDKIIQTNPTRGYGKIVFVGVVALLVIFAGVFALQTAGLILVDEPTSQQDQEVEGELAAIVGDAEIGTQQVEQRYTLFQVTANPFITREQTLQFLIEESVLRQEADKLGIEISEAELNQVEQELLAGSGASREDLEAQLAQEGTSYDELITYYQRGILSTELVEQEAFVDVEEPTEEEVRAFYDENTAQFITPRSAQVRQIVLIPGPEDNRSQDVEEIQTLLSEGEDFCELVEQYSDDPQAMQNCGETNVSEDGMTSPELVEEAFEAEEGEVRSVVTEQATFVFEKVGEVEEQQQAFEEVQEQIVQQLQNQRLEERYNEYVQQLLEEYGFEVLVEFEEEQQELPFEIQ